ncbi:MAG: Holliday junction branch migration protein RuvA, partial [candidate division Zixibacteria bacterium]|nr:Holliday junction branch migration protein RuvA [candidate division Zixibacteria bacterium]
VHGVGYHVHVPISTFNALPAVGKAVRLLTHFVVREDAHALYGFLTHEERDLFRLLIGISGIGPKMGMAILSGVPIQDLKEAIVNGSLAVLTAIPGIGKKTAERLIVELREKLILEERRAPAPAGRGLSAPDSLFEDSLSALEELGYRRQNAREALEKVLKEHRGQGKLSISELIRASLKYV